MAQKQLDPGMNESFSTFVGKLTSMFTELYNTFGGSPNPSVTTLTASGEVSAGSLGVTGASALAAVSATSLALTAGTATATAGAATLNDPSGIITTENLTTAAGATYTLTLTNSAIDANSLVMVNVSNGTNTTGVPVVSTVTATLHQVVIVILNAATITAFSGGTLKIGFTVTN